MPPAQLILSPIDTIFGWVQSVVEASQSARNETETSKIASRCVGPSIYASPRG
jgi:hypothetical protein